MTTDIKQLLKDLGIQYITQGKNVSKGWANVQCPFCDDPSQHLGINIEKGSCTCWKCGPHSTTLALARISGQSHQQIKRLWEQHRGRYGPTEESPGKRQLAPEILKLPPGIGSLSDRHRQYLTDRNFDPDDLAIDWGLLGTGPLGDYRFRIIAPIYHQSQMVSYQGRDITDKSNLKYMACKQEDEIIPHKHTLYGLDKVEGDRVLVVEGITDVWRIGPGAVGTYGISFTREQVALLSHFEKVYVLYDPEPQAYDQAEDLCHQMFNAKNLSHSYTDPAEMGRKDVINLRNYCKI